MSIFDLLPDNKKELPLMFGVIVALVTNNNDEKKLGRVKCKFISDSEEMETDWIRLAMPMSGKESGMFFLPEVNDEVLLAFAGGDISRPYVIGCLWNEDIKIPSIDKGGANIFRGVKNLNGSAIAYDFTKEKTEEKVYINTCDGEREILLEENTKTIQLHDKGDKNFIKIDSEKGEITINAAKKITLQIGDNKQTKIVIDSTGAISIASSNSLKVETTQANIEAKGNFALKSVAMDLKADGPAKISGVVVNING